MLIVKLRIQDFFSEVWWIWIIHLFAFRCVEKERRHEGKVYVWSLLLIPEFYRLKLLNSESVSHQKRSSHENWQVLRCQKCLNSSHQSQLRFWLVARLSVSKGGDVGVPKKHCISPKRIQSQWHADTTFFGIFVVFFPVFCRLLLKLKNTSLEIYLQTVSLFLEHFPWLSKFWQMLIFGFCWVWAVSLNHEGWCPYMSLRCQGFTHLIFSIAFMKLRVSL